MYVYGEPVTLARNSPWDGLQLCQFKLFTTTTGVVQRRYLYWRETNKQYSHTYTCFYSPCNQYYTIQILECVHIHITNLEGNQGDHSEDNGDDDTNDALLAQQHRRGIASGL